MTKIELAFSNPFKKDYTTDPAHPILSALREAELQKIDRVCELGNELIKLNELQLRDKLRWETLEKVIDELTSVLKGWIELMDWAYLPAAPLSADRAMDYVTWMRSQGLPESYWKKFYDMSQRRKRGRPVTKRQVAIRALEKRILEPGREWSDRELAQQFCDCKKQRHDQQCAASLRQTIIRLKKILEKYCPELTL